MPNTRAAPQAQYHHAGEGAPAELRAVLLDNPFAGRKKRQR